MRGFRGLSGWRHILLCRWQWKPYEALVSEHQGLQKTAQAARVRRRSRVLWPPTSHSWRRCPLRCHRRTSPCCHCMMEIHGLRGDTVLEREMSNFSSIKKQMWHYDWVFYANFKNRLFFRYLNVIIHCLKVEWHRKFIRANISTCLDGKKHKPHNYRSTFLICWFLAKL